MSVCMVNKKYREGDSLLVYELVRTCVCQYECKYYLYSCLFFRHSFINISLARDVHSCKNSALEWENTGVQKKPYGKFPRALPLVVVCEVVSQLSHATRLDNCRVRTENNCTYNRVNNNWKYCTAEHSMIIM